MLSINIDQLYELIPLFFIPLSRILGLMTTAPVLGHRTVPIQYKIGYGSAITLLVMPFLTKPDINELASIEGLIVITKEYIIGIAIGLTMQMVFTGVELAGEMISMTMGLGFSSFFDPQSQGRSYSLSQLLTLLAVLIFISNNYHLHMIKILVESFNNISTEIVFKDLLSVNQLPHIASMIFETGVHLSSPIVTIILITNLTFGILTKAAPQLNLFGIGFPATLLAGYASLLLVMIYLENILSINFVSAFRSIDNILYSPTK